MDGFADREQTFGLDHMLGYDEQRQGAKKGHSISPPILPASKDSVVDTDAGSRCVSRKHVTRRAAEAKVSPTPTSLQSLRLSASGHVCSSS